MQAAAVAVIIAVVLSIIGEIDAPARDRAQVRAFLRAQGPTRTQPSAATFAWKPPCPADIDNLSDLCLPVPGNRNKPSLLTLPPSAC